MFLIFPGIATPREDSEWDTGYVKLTEGECSKGRMKVNVVYLLYTLGAQLINAGVTSHYRYPLTSQICPDRQRPMS